MKKFQGFDLIGWVFLLLWVWIFRLYTFFSSFENYVNQLYPGPGVEDFVSNMVFLSALLNLPITEV
jgi:hypothetical protein